MTAAPKTTSVTNGVFASDYMYWVGIDTDLSTASEIDLAEFDEFYTQVHLPEVLQANPGFVLAARYRLEAPDPRGDFGPMWLAVYGIADTAGAEGYLARANDPAALRPAFTRGPAVWSGMSARWRILWRQVFSQGGRSAAPDTIMLIGMDPPQDSTPQDLVDFNEFYSHTHIPEVLGGGPFVAATRFERLEAFLHKQPDGCPRFCAVYEGSGEATPPPRQAGPPPPMAEGPSSWERRETTWRLRYRRVSELVSVPDPDQQA